MPAAPAGKGRAQVSNRSRRKPGGNQNSNRGPGRAARSTSATGFDEAPTEQGPALAQASVLGVWGANSPGQVQQGPWEMPARPGPLDEDRDEEQLQEEPGPQLDPDLAFGQPQAPRVDPLPQGATVSDAGASGSAGRTSRGASTASFPAGAKAPNPLAARGRAAAFAKLAAAGIAALSAVLNDRLAVDEEDETWLADEEDMDAIGQPAGRLIARKLPLPEGTDTSDLADAIEIAIGAAGYVAKNTREWIRGLREKRRGRAGVAVYEEA